jgi:hypothetical protein
VGISSYGEYRVLDGVEEFAGDRGSTEWMADRERQRRCRRACREREEVLLAEAEEAALDAANNEVVNARVASVVAK